MLASLRVSLIGLAGLIPLGPIARADDEPPSPPAAVTLTGRVVDLATNRPIAGVELTVTRLPLVAGAGPAPPWAGTETLRTGGDGRFTLAFPPDQVADPRLGVRVERVDHPDYIPRQTRRTPLADLIAEAKDGGESRLGRITLERGEVYTARVINPDGTPAAGVAASFQNWANQGNPSVHFFNDSHDRTDADGRLRLRTPRTQSLALQLTPERLAPFGHFWGTQDPAKEPDAVVPLDLGVITLDPGFVLTGRVLDREEGWPLAGQALVAWGRFKSVERKATTDADGRFTFPPLGQGNYLVAGAGQDGSSDPDMPQQSADAAILRPRAIFLDGRTELAPLELREAPTVRVSARLLDSQGRPVRGGSVTLAGTLPVLPEDATPGPLPGPAAPTNGPELKYADDELGWGALLVPDAAGRVEFRAPAGLQNARLAVQGGDDATAFRARPAPGSPLDFRGQVVLGLLWAYRPGIEFVQYRSPKVVVRVATEDGEPVPAQVEISPGFNVNGGDYGGTMIRQPDGLYRSQHLLPDQEYEFSAWAEGYVPQAVERLTLAEGAKAEVDLVLRKKPNEPIVGDLAPPFAVTTTDGRLRTLPDYRGKHLLIHPWSPAPRWDADLARVDAIGRRIGADRLAVLGLALTADVPAATRAIAGAQVARPQAILRDRGADPMVLDYDGMDPPKSILIGPDGTILARDLVGAQVDAAVDQFLNARRD